MLWLANFGCQEDRGIYTARPPTYEGLTNYPLSGSYLKPTQKNHPVDQILLSPGTSINLLYLNFLSLNF